MQARTLNFEDSTPSPVGPLHRDLTSDSLPPPAEDGFHANDNCGASSASNVDGSPTYTGTPAGQMLKGASCFSFPDPFRSPTPTLTCAALRRQGEGGGGGEAPLIMVPQTPAKQPRTIHNHGKVGATRLARNRSSLFRVPTSRTAVGGNNDNGRHAGHVNSVSATGGVTAPACFSTSGSAVTTKYMRSEVGRKRSADTISQFNTMDLNESLGSLPSQSTNHNYSAGVPLSIANLLGNLSSQHSQQQQWSSGLAGGGMGNAPANHFSPWQREPSAGTVTYSQQTAVERNSFSNMLVRPSQDALEVSQADTEHSLFFARRIVTDYKEVRELGRGSFGKVCLYEEISSAELVAVKVSLPAGNSDQEHRFRREKCIIGLLRGAPHVVQLLAAWEEGVPPRMYLQLEYCPGGSVASIAERKRARAEQWDEKEVLVFLAHMSIALDALHRNNIAHVDFKPDNILVDTNGAYKLSDFGCSVILDDAGRPQRSLRAYRTPTAIHGGGPRVGGGHFSASSGHSTTAGVSFSPHKVGQDYNFLQEPTQHSMVSVEEGDCRYLCADMLNQKLDFKAGDMFSLGMSLYELLSGRPLPQNGDAFLELRRSIPADALRQRGYSVELVNLVVSLTQEDPAARPTARDVLLFLRPPRDALELLGSEPTMRRWTFGADHVQRLVADCEAAAGDLRFVGAMLEASTWLFETVQRDYVLALRGAGGDRGSNCDGDSNTVPGEAPRPSKAPSPLPLNAQATQDGACTPVMPAHASGNAWVL